MKIQILTFVMLIASMQAMATNYYFDAAKGDDNNRGRSPRSPFRSTAAIDRLKLKSGDCLLFAAGQTFHGMVFLENVAGSSRRPIVIRSYGNGRALIDGRGMPGALILRNCNHITVEGLDLTANGGGTLYKDKAIDMRCGILIDAKAPGHYGGITIRECNVSDVFFEEPGFERNLAEMKTSNGTQPYGWGIRVINNHKGAVIDNVLIDSCNVSRVSHTGIKFTGEELTMLTNMRTTRNTVTHVGGPGIQMSCTTGAYFGYNKVDHSGSSADSRNWKRGSGLWTWGASDVLIEHNSFTNASGPADSAGAHIDYNCNNVVMQYNFSANNAGGFIEVLGNNHNCCYRFNVSVNDGWREKGVDGAFQEGKSLWLSGFATPKRNGPYNTYVYNNTIWVRDDLPAKVAVENTSDGAFIANNIFYIPGKTTTVPGDQYDPEKAGESQLQNIVFRGNLFLHPGSWPIDNIKDEAPRYGDPGFAKPGGWALTDYIPSNSALVEGGATIEKIPGDQIGLTIGLYPETDILGKPLTGKPFAGAISPY